MSDPYRDWPIELNRKLKYELLGSQDWCRVDVAQALVCCMDWLIGWFVDYLPPIQGKQK
jgi:hypothetical protein